MRISPLLLMIAAVAAPMNAQSLASRVAAERDGAVMFHFTPRAGVCGDGEHFIRTGHSSYHGSYTSGRVEPCIAGPVQVRLTIEDGSVHRVQYWLGPLRPREARDFGRVPAVEAANYLIGLARSGLPRTSARAIFPAILADSAVIWPALLAVAKDSATRSRSTRREALMWLSRYAGAAVAGYPNDPFALDDEPSSADDDLRSHAVFVLSQLPRGDGVPQLLEVARSNNSPRVRAQAFFWLGQSGDERAVALFERVLRNP